MHYLYHLRQTTNPQDAYIVCKLTQGKKAKVLTTGIRIPRSVWDPESKTPVTNTEKDLLTQHQDRLALAIAACRSRGTETIDAVVSEMEGQVSTATICGLVEWYNKGVQSRVLNPRSRQVYNQYAKNLTDTISQRYPTLEAEYMTLQQGRTLYEDLRKKLALSTAAKTITYLRRAFASALDEGLLKRNPISKLTCPRPKPKRDQLTRQEVQKLYALQPNGVALKKARLLFLLSLESGAAYSDLQQVRPENVVEDEGVKVLHYQRNKSGEDAWPVVRPELEKLWEAGVHTYKLANQDLNEKLKLLCLAAGITRYEQVTFHWARRTFGQLRLNEGYSMEAVTAMLGHSDVRMTQKHYCRPGLSRVVLESKKGL